MTNELTSQLLALRGVAPRINSVLDDVNDIIKRVERALVTEMAIAVVASTADAFSERRLNMKDAETGEITEYRQDRYLSYGRIGGEYCIHVTELLFKRDGERWRPPQPGTSEQIPWSQCDRETRLKAFVKLPQLLARIIRANEKLAELADETAKKVEEMTLGNEADDSAERSSGRAENIVERKGIRMIIVPVVAKTRGQLLPDGSFWCYVLDKPGNSHSNRESRRCSVIPVVNPDKSVQRFASWEDAVSGGIAYGELWLNGRV
jgi:hypothetical protein